MPTNIAAVMALVEQMGEVPTWWDPATQEDINTFERLWKYANIVMILDEYIAMFGRPTAESPWGSRVRQGMLRLVAKYATQGPRRSCGGRGSSWYLNHASHLHWGWWQIPEHFSYDNAVTPPGPNDNWFVPCVYFYCDGEWWMICLHLLLYLMRTWRTHPGRCHGWHIV